MATARSPTQTWVAKSGRLFMDYAANITINSTTTLSGAFVSAGFALEAAVKNITVTPPETSWEKQDFIGQDTSDFQNQLLDEKPVGTATLTGTMVLGEDETVENLLSGSFTAVTGGYSRYQYGSDNTSAATAVVTAVVSMTTPTFGNTVSFGLDNARFTKLGDTRISGPDSHWEQDFTIVCLPKDFYYEFKD